MELITGIFGTIAAFFVAVAAHFVAHDAYSSAPRYARRLIERAVRALPESERDRYREEWLADLNERPSVLSKFHHAIECCICTRKLAGICTQKTTKLSVPQQLGSPNWKMSLDAPSCAFLLLVLKLTEQVSRRIGRADFDAILADVQGKLGPVNLDDIETVSRRMLGLYDEDGPADRVPCQGAINGVSRVTAQISALVRPEDQESADENDLRQIDEMLSMLG
jgi:hypothetical protein